MFLRRYALAYVVEPSAEGELLVISSVLYVALRSHSRIQWFRFARESKPIDCYSVTCYRVIHSNVNHLPPEQAVFTEGLKSEAVVFKAIYAWKQPPQRLFSRDQLRICGARGNTRTVYEAQRSVRLSELYLLNTVSFLEVFSADRVRSTVHNWVHKSDLRPETGQSPNHVAVDETVIQLDDEQYWLYAAVGVDSNYMPHTRLESTRNTSLPISLSRNSAKNTTWMTRSLSSMARLHYSESVTNTTSISDTNDTEIGIVSNITSVR